MDVGLTEVEKRHLKEFNALHIAPIQEAIGEWEKRK